MENPMSFWQLIGRFKIVIPVIQRDYAQGRDNPRAIDVRKKIVEKIVSALKEDDKAEFFDFVYGRIEGEAFIPFDGQQRLTTLFLLHKYVFERCGKCVIDSCKCTKTLARFSYATRQSSREFCESLVNERIVPKDSEEGYAEQSIEKFIRNQAWFFPDWNKDPTIRGMLVMLDEIHSQFTKYKDNVDYSWIAQKLTSPCACPVTFHFVDMEGFGIPDEVYVKMNARGKRLTPFENFKASLEQYLEGSKTSAKLLKSMKESIDGKWLDVFWGILNPDDKTDKTPPDALMLSFVNRHILNVWEAWYANNYKSESAREKLEEDELKAQTEYDKLNGRLKAEMLAYPANDDFVSWELYDSVINHCGLDKCIQPIFNVWDALSEPAKNIIEIDKVKKFKNNCQPIWLRQAEDESSKNFEGKKSDEWDPFSGKKRDEDWEEYSSRVVFYALLGYFRYDTDVSGLDQWMRIVWNIVENSTIDSEDTYRSALQLIEELVDKPKPPKEGKAPARDILNWLARSQNEIQSGFAKDQLKEERLKARKLLAESIAQSNSNIMQENGVNYSLWQKLIYRAEALPCLWGKIKVLFHDGETTTNDTFKARLDMLEQIWKTAESTPYHLQKVLLSNYDSDYPRGEIDLSNARGARKKLLTQTLSDCFQKVMSDTISESTRPWINDLTLTELLNKRSGDRNNVVSKYGARVVLWGKTVGYWYSFGNQIKETIILGIHRSLLISSPGIELENRGDRVAETNFVSGKDINFRYGEYRFRWLGAPDYDNGEYDIYLLKEKWNDDSSYAKHGKDSSEYYCFNVSELAVAEDDGKKARAFKDALDNLIKAAQDNQA